MKTKIDLLEIYLLAILLMFTAYCLLPESKPEIVQKDPYKDTIFNKWRRIY